MEAALLARVSEAHEVASPRSARSSLRMSDGMAIRRAALCLALASCVARGPSPAAPFNTPMPLPQESVPAGDALSTQKVPTGLILHGDFFDLRASLGAPARVTYDPWSLGVAGQFVSIHLENIGARVVPIAQLHATFSSTREGIAFPCNAHVSRAVGAIEPSHLAVALVNGSGRPILVGPSRISLLIFKQGAALPCTGRQQRLDEPDTLASGAVHVVRVPVTCAPTEEGRYEIVGHLAIGDAAEVEIGRVGLLVTHGPDFLFAPDWPGLLQLPRSPGP